ncbi:CBS domain-containing protein [Thiorhodococcus fuscus]|uniref:CBS domain-containing protein n=1 Tax=Thiorhodococcus fuscus TaxID=527200 RepID=A0ABW4Y6K7_9GAMM
MQPIVDLTLADIMSRDVRHLPPDVPLAEAARQMAQARISSLLVLDGTTPIGILTERDLLRLLHQRTDTATPIREVMSTPVLTAIQETDFAAAYHLALSHRIRHLVVIDGNGRAVGIASETDFRHHLGLRSLQQLGDLTTLIDRDLPFLPPEAPLTEVLALMVRQDAAYALAVDGGRPLGILTERDIPRLLAQGADAELADVRLRDVMQTPVRTVCQNTPVPEAAQSMREQQLRQLAVVDADGQVMGMVTLQRQSAVGGRPARIGTHRPGDAGLLDRAPGHSRRDRQDPLRQPRLAYLRTVQPAAQRQRLRGGQLSEGVRAGLWRGFGGGSQRRRRNARHPAGRAG